MTSTAANNSGMNRDLKLAPFIVFEGLDGSGKTTLIKSLESRLKARSLSTQLTREPGGTPLAEEIRRLLLRTDGEVPAAATELLLYTASRAQHVARLIKPALQNGTWVLCDRFVASSVAFQCYARGILREDVDQLNRFAQQGLVPDITVLLDLTVEESNKRQQLRFEHQAQTKDRMEQEPSAFHQAVRRGYLEQAGENPAGWLVLDATLPPERLCEAVLKELEMRSWLPR